MDFPKEPAFTLGIEEEYLLVDRATGALADEVPAGVMEAVRDRLDRTPANAAAQVQPEFLRSQLEVGTRICASIAEARTDLGGLRRAVADVAGEHGLAPIAASTHPFAQWHEQKRTEKDRYHALAQDLQGVARRMLIGGMHVHVGIEDEELRIDLMNQVAYFLPHLLALSTSSPFWRGRDTGLKSYRISVFNELPRTGLPEQFDSWGEYQRHLDILIAAGLIEDSSKIWWDVRPSATFPTLELRIPDICPMVDDAICVAALYLCLLRMLFRLRRTNQRWRVHARMLVDENRWRAQRYGFDEGLVDFGRGRVVPYSDLLEEMIQLTEEDQAFFGCTREVQHARTILARGTSAHRQLQAFHKAREAGADEREALRKVVDQLISETTDGV